MTLRRCNPMLVLLFAVLFATSPVRGQTSSEADKALEQLAWAVGGKWVSEIKGPKDSVVTVETTFEWATHRKAIKYAIVLKTGDQAIPNYEGTYWWNPERKQLALLQIDRQGNVTEAVLTKEGDQFKQINTVLLADGTKREQRAEFIREGDDTFAFKALVKKSDEWVESLALKYKRVRDAK